MLEDDETIVMNAVMFAKRWGLQPWIDIRWDDEAEMFSTFILYSSDLDEAECEISSLEELNILLATEQEFYKNITTLAEIGAIELHDVDVEALIMVAVSRIMGTSEKQQFPYSMVNGSYAVTGDYYQKIDADESSVRLVLDTLKLFSRTGDWWGETIQVSYIHNIWDSQKKEYVDIDEKYFSVHVEAHDSYTFACYQSAEVTPENWPLLESAVEDVLSELGSAQTFKQTRNHWASVLFCERSGKVDDILRPGFISQIPEELREVFVERSER